MSKRKQEPITGKGAAIIYCRVSTKGQEEDGTSLDSQESAGIKHAEELGYTVGRVTREVYTGAELWDRPKLAIDRADLKAGQFQALIVYAIDRLSRDPIHLAIIADECERAGVALEFVSEPLDATPEGQLIRYVKGYAAKLEREKIRERQMRGKRQRALSGKVLNAGFDLYGYKKDREAGTRIIYEPEAAVIRNIFTWIGVETVSLKTVVDRLNERGIPSPAAGKVQFSEGGRRPRWGTGTLGRMLRQPAYKGEGYAWRYKARKQTSQDHGGTILRPEDEWIRLPDGVVPAIVSPELWDAVQRQLDTNMGQHTRNMNKARQYLLRGLVTCAVCGRAMYAQPTRDFQVYRCSSRTYADRPCGSSSVGAQLVETWVWEQVTNVLRNPEIIAEEVRRRQDEGPDPMLTSDLDSARRTIAKLEKQQAGLGTRLREAIDDAMLWDLLKSEIAKIEREKGEMLAVIVDMESRLAQQQHLMDQLETIPSYCERVAQNLDTFGFEEKRLAIEALGIRVKVNGRQWHLEGRIPLGDGVVSHLSSLSVHNAYRFQFCSSGDSIQRARKAA